MLTGLPHSLSSVPDERERERERAMGSFGTHLVSSRAAFVYVESDLSTYIYIRHAQIAPSVPVIPIRSSDLYEKAT